MMNFLFVISIPLCCLLWLHHAVWSLVGRWSSELSANLPMKFSYRVAICFLMLVIPNNAFLTASFVMSFYFA